MVAVSSPAGGGGWAVRAGRARVKWRSRRRRAVAALAGAAGVLVRWAATLVLVGRAPLGLALLSYGAWLAYHPAGWIVPGLLLLSDRVADEVKAMRGPQ